MREKDVERGMIGGGGIESVKDVGAQDSLYQQKTIKDREKRVGNDRRTDSWKDNRKEMFKLVAEFSSGNSARGKGT
jgi:hypothetical protein